jgi:hypothetical protein
MQEASASPVGAGSRIGDLQVQPLRNTMPPPASGDEMLAYQTVYHPSATRLTDATRLRVGPGEEKAGVDLQMKLARTFRVSGQVFGADGQPLSAGLTLLPADARDLAQDNNFETATAVSGEDGRFVFLGVPAGDYIARMLRVPRPTGSPGIITTISSGAGGIIGISTSGGVMDGPPPVPSDEPTLWAETPVHVAGHVDDVTVSVRAGARVRGTVVFEGGSAPLEPQQRRVLSFSLAPVTGRLGGIRQPPPGRLVDEDTFVTSQYPPGRYFMNITGALASWTVRSATVGGRNALEEPLDLGAGDLDGVVVTITDGKTQLSGTVHGGTGTAAHAVVLVFPADHERWIANGMRTTRARTTAASADGSFQIIGLPPGDYRAVALPADAAADVQDADTIEALARAAVPITLAVGQTRSVSLTVTSSR